MTLVEKLAQLKALLKITDTTLDPELTVFLDFAKTEILAWLYSGETPAGVKDVPERYIPTQIMACVSGYGLIGLENQTKSVENSITREFKYSNMIEFIRNNVTPCARVV